MAKGSNQWHGRDLIKISKVTLKLDKRLPSMHADTEIEHIKFAEMTDATLCVFFLHVNFSRLQLFVRHKCARGAVHLGSL
jgi:hypothetical protein